MMDRILGETGPVRGALPHAAIGHDSADLPEDGGS